MPQSWDSIRAHSQWQPVCLACILPVCVDEWQSSKQSASYKQMRLYCPIVVARTYGLGPAQVVRIAEDVGVASNRRWSFVKLAELEARDAGLR